MTPAQAQGGGSRDVDAHIAGVGGWRGEVLARMRRLIRDADPAIVEEVKWRKPSNGMAGVPVWSHDGLVCTGEPYKDKVKFTFAKGFALPDPRRLFNGPDRGATRRAIDVREGDEVDAQGFRDLVRAAVALNAGKAGRAPRAAARAPAKAPDAHASRPARAGSKAKRTQAPGGVRRRA